MKRLLILLMVLVVTLCICVCVWVMNVKFETTELRRAVDNMRYVMHTSTDDTEVAETLSMTQKRWGPLLHVTIDGTSDGMTNEAFLAMPSLGKSRCLALFLSDGAPVVIMVHPFSSKGYDYLKNYFVVRSETSSGQMLNAIVSLRDLQWNLHSETNASQSTMY